MTSTQSLPVFAKDVNLTEIEFFKRELNLELIDELRTINNGKLAIACTNPLEYEEILMNRPEKSIIFFFWGTKLTIYRDLHILTNLIRLRALISKIHRERMSE